MGVNSAIGYLLILAVMSFNGRVFMMIIVGLGIGDTSICPLNSIAKLNGKTENYKIKI